MTQPINLQKPIGLDEVLSDTQVTYKNKALWLSEAFDQAIEEAAKESIKSQKQAKIKFELVFKPSRMNEMELGVKLNIELPKAEPRVKTVWFDDRGRIFKEDPAQLKMEMTDLGSIGKKSS